MTSASFELNRICNNLSVCFGYGICYLFVAFMYHQLWASVSCQNMRWQYACLFVNSGPYPRKSSWQARFQLWLIHQSSKVLQQPTGEDTGEVPVSWTETKTWTLQSTRTSEAQWKGICGLSRGQAHLAKWWHKNQHCQGGLALLSVSVSIYHIM